MDRTQDERYGIAAEPTRTEMLAKSAAGPLMNALQTVHDEISRLDAALDQLYGRLEVVTGNSGAVNPRVSERSDDYGVSVALNTIGEMRTRLLAITERVQLRTDQLEL